MRQGKRTKLQFAWDSNADNNAESTAMILYMCVCVCAGAAIRQSLRPLHVLQSTATIDRVHVHVDRDREWVGESRRRRPPSGSDDGLRRRRRAAAARLVELRFLALYHNRFVHEVRSCAELICVYDTGDTIVVK